MGQKPRSGKILTFPWVSVPGPDGKSALFRGWMLLLRTALLALGASDVIQDFNFGYEVMMQMRTVKTAASLRRDRPHFAGDPRPYFDVVVVWSYVVVVWSYVIVIGGNVVVVQGPSGLHSQPCCD